MNGSATLGNCCGGTMPEALRTDWSRSGRSAIIGSCVEPASSASGHRLLRDRLRESREGFLPCPVIEALLCPPPRVLARVNLVTGSANEVATHLAMRHRQRSIGFRRSHFQVAFVSAASSAALSPCRTNPVCRVICASGAHCPMFHTTAAITFFSAWREWSGQIDRPLITPVKEIAARGPPCETLPVHEQLIAVVAAYMDDKPGGLCREFDGLAEMVNAVRVGISTRGTDPFAVQVDRRRSRTVVGAPDRFCVVARIVCASAGRETLAAASPAPV